MIAPTAMAHNLVAAMIARKHSKQKDDAGFFGAAL
jgi:hypothetical protein